MNVVGKVGSLISQGVYSVATPFHPFGGAVDIIIVEQPDGTYRSTPWYVRFGKFQGVLRGTETVVRISVNCVEAGFHMYLDNSGEAYFLREAAPGKDNEDDQDLENNSILEASRDGNDNCQTENEVSIADDIDISNVCDENVKINSEHEVFEFHDEQISHVSPVGSPGYGAYHCGSLEDVGELAESQGGSDSGVVLVSVDGHVLRAPFSSSEKNSDNVQLSMPQFHLGPAEVADVAIEQLQDSAESNGNNGDLRTSKDAWTTSLFGDMDALTPSSVSEGIFSICGDDNTPSYPSDGCRDVRNFTYQAQEVLNIKNVRNNLGMNIDTGMGEKEIFTSCLELSELISGSEGDNSRGIESSSMGLAATGGTCDPQEETETGDEHKLENGAGLTFPNSESLCSNESPTVNTQIEAPENSALNTEKTDSVISEGVTTPPNTNGSKQKSEQLGVSSEMQRLESGQGVPASENCNKPGIRDSHSGESSDKRSNGGMGIEISLCHNLLRAGMGLDSAREAFNAHRITEEEFKVAGVSIVKNENLIARFKEKYFTWDKAASIILGIAAFGLDFPAELKDDIPVEKETPKLVVDSPQLSSSPGRSWRLWPIPFRRIKTLQHSNSNSSGEEVFVDSELYVSPRTGLMEDPNGDIQSPQKQFVRMNIPTSEQIASLNLKDGQNIVAFSCYTRVLGKQKVDAHIYLWKWNAKIVISDVDGTITRGRWKEHVNKYFLPKYLKQILGLPKYLKQIIGLPKYLNQILDYVTGITMGRVVR